MAIYFCHDGILRTHDQEHKMMFSLSFVQHEQQSDDFSFWAYWWNSPVFFEKNLTLGNFFKCLSPWQSFWGTFLQKDLASYIDEIKKPISVDQLLHYDWIDFSYQTDLFPHIEHLGETTSVKKYWTLEHSYQCRAYHLGHKMPHAIYYQPLNQIAHVPLILNPYQIVIADDFLLSQYQANSINLFNSDANGVFKDQESGFHYIRCIKQHIFKDMIEGFFQRFDVDITQRDKHNEIIRQTIDDTIEESAFNIPENQLSLLDDIIMEDRAFIAPTTSLFSEISKRAMKDMEQSHFILGKFTPGKPLEYRLNSKIMTIEN